MAAILKKREANASLFLVLLIYGYSKGKYQLSGFISLA